MTETIRQGIGGMCAGAVCAVIALAVKGSSETIGAVLLFAGIGAVGVSLAIIAWELLAGQSSGNSSSEG